MTTTTTAVAALPVAADMHNKRHLVVFVHGIWGNSKEYDYLVERLQQHSSLYLHAATCNEGSTTDGIDLGGQRLAQEINAILNSHTFETFSIVGNSLGGLYSRYALKDIELGDTAPVLFCTTATPHLGTRDNTYIPVSRLDFVVAKFMGKTGQDLFHYTDVMPDLTNETYMEPLRRFQRRLALANAYNTDFQVPFATAAFMDGSSNVPHKVVPHECSEADRGKASIALKVETEAQSVVPEEASATHALDSLGWTKWFCDVSPTLYGISTSGLLQDENDQSPEIKQSYSAKELLDRYGRFINSKLAVPWGHSVMIVNSKNEAYRKINQGGAPIMHELAEEIRAEILGVTED